MGKVKPQFNSKLPKNAGSFFSPASDLEFKAEHPFGYHVLLICGFIALFLPLVIYLAFVLFIYPAPNSAWLMLGWLGAFIIGIGLFNIAAAWIKQYLGHMVTIVCYVIGTIFVIASILLLYNDYLYALFDQSRLTYYFVTLLLLLFYFIYYVMFRLSIDTLLRSQRISKSRIRKLKRGIKNYWWYEEIQKIIDLGWKYRINKAFTILYSTIVFAHILFGWLKVISIPVSLAQAVLAIMAAIMMMFSCIQENLDFHGRPFVLLARSRNKGIDSILLDLASVSLPLAVAYAQVKMMMDLWK